MSAAGGPSRARVAWAAAATIAVARHPELWATALRQVRLLAEPGWWRHPPHLPLPAPDYLRFRLQTAYGDDRDPEPADVVTYLHWCRAWPTLTRPLGRRPRRSGPPPRPPGRG